MRLHLFEFHDLVWLPHSLRNDLTEFLQFYYDLANAYSPIFKLILEVLRATKQSNIIDLCSGAGGPQKKLREYLNTHEASDITITLTDLYPNKNAFSVLAEEFPNQIESCPIPIDARNIPDELKGMRVMFTSFHHFREQDALKILQNSVKNNMPIGIFEIPERSFWCASRALIGGFIMPFFLIPFSPNLSLRKLFLTYIIPIIPFLISWDGFVSCLRTYSPDELKKLTNNLQVNFAWQAGKLFCTKGLYNITYLIGRPFLSS